MKLLHSKCSPCPKWPMVRSAILLGRSADQGKHHTAPWEKCKTKNLLTFLQPMYASYFALRVSKVLNFVLKAPKFLLTLSHVMRNLQGIFSGMGCKNQFMLFWYTFFYLALGVTGLVLNPNRYKPPLRSFVWNRPRHYNWLRNCILQKLLPAFCDYLDGVHST